ncbi:MAG: hypothetical protein R3359_08670 [Marinirhabdus sp.]|nr:hypothetical protein [Marinirhabdus sp.]
MKKFITGIAFAIVVLFGMNTATAQSLATDNSRPEAIAKATVAELSSELNLTGEQQRSLFRAYVQKEVNYNKDVNGKDLKSAAVIADKKKHDETLAINAKRILTPEQYKKWQSMQK